MRSKHSTFLLRAALALMTAIILLLCVRLQDAPDAPDDQDCELEQALAYGQQVHEQIDTLYQSAVSELEANAETILMLKQENSPLFDMYIEQDQESNSYLWFDYETYERHPIVLSSGLRERFDDLFHNYGVTGVQISDHSIGFKIVEDTLFYFPAPPEEAPEHSIQFDDHWYHVWFEYGV